MPAGKLQFGNLNLSWVTEETEGVEIYSTIFNLYDGRTIISGVSQVGTRPSFNGISRGESFVTDVVAEVGSRHNLTVNDKALGVAQIVSFDYSYDRYDGSYNYYRWRLGFGVENLS